MATYDAAWVRAYFDDYGQNEWDRWDAGPVARLQFDVHRHYLREHLRPTDRVLEVGAGPGRFTRVLAGLARSIVVADISPVQLVLNRRNAGEMGFAQRVDQWVELDVCDMHPHFGDGEFDAVVAYGGPLSYVFEQRHAALRELLRVLKPGGVLLLSVMCLWGSAHQGLPDVLGLDPELNRRIIATGDIGPEESAATRHRCHLYRAREFRSFLEETGADIVALSASNCLSAC